MFNLKIKRYIFKQVHFPLKPKRYLRADGIPHLSELSLFENQPAMKSVESGCKNCKFLNILESYIHISAVYLKINEKDQVRSIKFPQGLSFPCKISGGGLQPLSPPPILYAYGGQNNVDTSKQLTVKSFLLKLIFLIIKWLREFTSSPNYPKLG